MRLGVFVCYMENCLNILTEIFQSISQGGQRIGKNSFRLPDGTIITKYSSSTTGVPTIHINKQGQLFKIRVETGINIE